MKLKADERGSEWIVANEQRTLVGTSWLVSGQASPDEFVASIPA